MLASLASSASCAAHKAAIDGDVSRLPEANVSPWSSAKRPAKRQHQWAKISVFKPAVVWIGFFLPQVRPSFQALIQLLLVFCVDESKEYHDVPHEITQHLSSNKPWIKRLPELNSHIPLSQSAVGKNPSCRTVGVYIWWDDEEVFLERTAKPSGYLKQQGSRICTVPYLEGDE